MPSGFSLSTFPDGKNMQLAFLFVAVGGAFFAANLFVPSSWGQSGLMYTAMQRVADAEMEHSLLAGQFRPSTFKGDTRTSFDLTFYGLYVLTSETAKNNGFEAKHKNKAKDYVVGLESKNFNRNLKEIYEGIVLLKRLGAMNAKKADKLYNLILEFGEKDSAFRMDALSTPSISASYYAIKAIEELEYANQFKSSEQHASTLQFVSNQRDSNLFGFIDTTLNNQTSLAATYFAVQIISDPEKIVNAEQYVYACQSQDGGFSNYPMDSLARYYNTESDAATTIMGIHILSKLGYGATNMIPTSNYANALNYLRYQLPSLNLQESYLLVHLLNEYSYFSLSAPKSITLTFTTISFISFVAAVFCFYKPQVSEEALGNAYKQFQTVLVFLVAGYYVQQSFPAVALLVYLAFLFYLASEYYNAQSVDTSDGTMILIGSVTSVVYMGLVLSFAYVSPFAFAQPSTFIVLSLWAILSSFIGSYGSCYFVGKNQMKLSFFVRSGFLAWVNNLLLIFMFLNGRADISLFQRLVEIKGLDTLILIGFPYTTLLLSYLFSAIGFLVYTSK